MSQWQPTLYTQPLREDFETDGDKLLRFIDLAWKSPESKDFKLMEWQRWLIRAVLERYPADHADPKKAGRLRYRQVVISMGRQNGKSVLGAIFALYGLILHTQGPEVIGLAYSKEQADIIFKRCKFVIDNNASLRKRFKTTATRGIRSLDGTATYAMKSKAENSLQGITMSLCLYDEVHLTKEETWDAVLFGTSARQDGLVLGITTAGDDTSTLLKRLYKTGQESAVGEGDERFGFFCWEAPAHLDVGDPQALIMANPSIAEGHVDLAQELNVVSQMAEHKARRYRLNQFVSSANSWLPMGEWNSLETAELPVRDGVTFGVDRTTSWKAATVTASVKHEGRTYTQVIASIPNPSLETLESVCAYLAERYDYDKFYMESTNLKELAARLRERGVRVEYLTQGQMISASALFYSLITRGQIVHAGDPLLRDQVPRGVAKNHGEGWRVSRRDSVGDIDALLATLMACYGAEISEEQSAHIFVA